MMTNVMVSKLKKIIFSDVFENLKILNENHR